MTECTNHHQACECREELMKKIVKRILAEHQNEKWSLSNNCDCAACEAARKLYPELGE